MAMTAAVKAYWQAFLQKRGLPEDTPCYEVFAFGSGEAMATALLALVLAGQKTATTSALPACELLGLGPPRPGQYSVVTDHAGNPACVIRTAAVAIVPFRAVTWEMARREGEDENLDSWRSGHLRYLTREGAEMGYAFSQEMPVVFEDFEVVHR